MRSHGDRGNEGNAKGVVMGQHPTLWWISMQYSPR